VPQFATFAIEDHILEKIAIKHRVSFEEIDEAFYNRRMQVRVGRHNTYHLFSQTLSGRYVVLFVADHGEGSWQIASARDMSLAERRMFQQTRRTQ
jgi:hypothetical protein